jgi:hypothetical protein
MMNAADVARARFARDLAALLLRHGAMPGSAFTTSVQRAVDNMLDALPASSLDGTSLTPLEVVRIRANKLAAVLLPPTVFRDRERLAHLRGELHALARDWLAEHPLA